MATVKLSKVRKEVLEVIATRNCTFDSFVLAREAAAYWLQDNGFIEVKFEGDNFLRLTPAGKTALGMSEYQVGDLVETRHNCKAHQGVIRKVDGRTQIVELLNGGDTLIRHDNELTLVSRPTMDADTLQIESNGDIFAKHYSDVTVAVETPAAQDSDYQPEVGDVVSFPRIDKETHRGYWVDGTIFFVAPNYVSIEQFDGSTHIRPYMFVTLVSHPTIAAVAITDDSAVDTTPSEQQSEISQPSRYTGSLVGTEQDTPNMRTWIDAGFRLTDIGTGEVLLALADVADALQSVNVTTEAVANDDYLPPTGDDFGDSDVDYAAIYGTNDDLPFSDLGEDDIDATDWAEGDKVQAETIASLEARVKELETAIIEFIKAIGISEDGGDYRVNQALLYYNRKIMATQRLVKAVQ